MHTALVFASLTFLALAILSMLAVTRGRTEWVRFDRALTGFVFGVIALGCIVTARLFR